jgi:lipid II:glycine glycyltransferase (peptidoglycan interpeptide bridge formation enzyme)
LKQEYQKLLSTFACSFNLRRYTAAATLVPHTMTMARSAGACQIDFDGTEKLWDDTAHGRKVIEKSQHSTMN